MNFAEYNNDVAHALFHNSLAIPLFPYLWPSLVKVVLLPIQPTPGWPSLH